MTVAIIVDLDGTLSDLTHRQHFLEQKPKDWESFFKSMPGDPPNGFLLDLLRPLADVYQIIICTGRPDIYRRMTLDWLAKYRVPFHHLMMRDQNKDEETEEGENLLPDKPSWRPDHEIKLEMLRSIRSEGYVVLCSIDDRPSVVKMWRENGVPCLAMDDSSWVKRGQT